MKSKRKAKEVRGKRESRTKRSKTTFNKVSDSEDEFDPKSAVSDAVAFPQQCSSGSSSQGSSSSDKRLGEATKEKALGRSSSSPTSSPAEQGANSKEAPLKPGKSNSSSSTSDPPPLLNPVDLSSILIKRSGKKYACPKCSLLFDNRSNVQRHYKAKHASVQGKKCPYCDEHLRDNSKVNLHIRKTHKGMPLLELKMGRPNLKRE